ncbi:MAG TPA: ethanolamine ammonia-lyase subunit EutC [Bacillota bacterium]|nr:ethanolamine ammonia-lyase subunit EutC [Bacillota bacterium]
MRGMEDSIKMIIEQVLNEIAITDSGKTDSGPAEEAGRTARGMAAKEASVKAAQIIDSSDGADFSAVDLQTQLLVPDPKNKDLYMDMKRFTAARLGVWRAGSRPLTETLLRLRADHAVAQDSVLGEISEEDAAKYKMVFVKSACRDKDEYLTRPDLGRVLNDESTKKLEKECEKRPQVQILAADGLSSRAVEANLPDLFPALLQGLQSMGLKVGTPIMAGYARVGLMDSIGEVLQPDVCVNLIGERPGLGTAESMSAYIVYNPRAGVIESERTVISNIHKGGTPAVEAGAHIAALIKKILDAKASGVNLKIRGGD